MFYMFLNMYQVTQEPILACLLPGSFAQSVERFTDNDTITAGAVASSLDLGLYLSEKLIGKKRTEIIRKSMDYHPSQFEILKV